ncbi:MAG TPA: M28 family metallopeptidase, partial [Bryobacteraceae bacterium]|nr:M28 family metallopeptidase [Bryobacteraceae bacterium]
MRSALALPLLAAAATGVTNWETAGNAWWSHVQYLADDKLEGRNVGTPGFEAAADYVVAQFERAGLQPGRQTSYSQPVAFTKVTLDEPNSHLTLLREGQSLPIQLGEEALLTSTSNVSGIEAPLVFVGYGLDIPEAGYSDLKDPSLKGAVAVYLAGGPSNIASEIRSHHASAAERGSAMKAAGVVATIAIPNPRSMDLPWARQSANRLLPRMGLADPAFAEAPAIAFSATWNPAKADDLFTGSGHTIAEILDAADHDRPLPHIPLALKIRAQVATTREKVESRNIVGVRPGSDRTLKKEYVILSAHLDHLGAGEKIHGDGIFNGAMDDASGVASLIEIARALQTGNAKTKRSIVFLAVTGEEKGELGSRYFAEYPTSEGRIVADINMDMYLPLFPLRYLEVQGLNESTLGDDIRAVAGAARVEIQADKDPNANRFIRSDQYSFVKKGVPAL